MTEKVIGYSLLAVGVLVIIFSAVNVFFVFTGQVKPVTFFQFSGVSIPQLGPTEIIPAAMINDSSNLAAHLFLVGFFASIGQKLAFLGVQLVRPIIIKSKDDKTTISNS